MILEKLISMICEEFGFSEDEVDGSAPLYEFINDDAELEELVLSLESEFETEFAEEIDTDISVSELADMIEESIG